MGPILAVSERANIQTLIQNEFKLVPNFKYRGNPHIVVELFTALTLFLT